MSFLRTGGAWISTPFTNCKNAVERMKAHEKSDTRVHATQAALHWREHVVMDQSYNSCRE